jgi:hypothetical protein
MAKLNEVVSARELAAWWNKNPKYREPYFGESKFPNAKKLGLDLSWIKGAKKAPVMLSPSSFDAKVIPLSRQGFEKLTYEMPFFKNSMVIDEKTRQELLLVLESGNQAVIDMLLGNIYDDKATLLEDAALTREAMRMQALTTGVVSISGNGQAHTYDYGVPANHKVTPSVKWDSADADPIADINNWADELEAEIGVRPAEILMNSVTFSYIQKSNAVKEANAGQVLNRERVLAFIQSETGMTVYIYNKGYDNNGVFTKFVADGTVVLMPEEKLGNTWFGTTPEEADLRSGSKAEVAIVDTGVAVATYKEVDAVQVVTKVSEIVLPSFELADRVIIASVK